MRVEGNVVGAGDRRDLVGRVAREVGLVVDRGVTGDEQDVPVEGGAGRVVIGLGELDDVAVAVLLDGVGLVDRGLALAATIRVLGHGHVDLARDGAALDVLGAVHLGGAHLVGGETRVDEDLLDAHAGDQRLLVVGELDPLARTVEGAIRGQLARTVDLVGRGGVELGDVEVAAAQELLVGAPVGIGVVLELRHELVDVVEGLIVTHVADDRAVVGDADVATLVLEAAQGGVLDRGRGGVVRIDLHDPAEAMGLVGVLVEVEAVVDHVPLPARLGLDAVTLLLVGARTGEVLVEVLLARQDGAPRGGAAGAVVQGAEDGHALGVSLGLQELRAGGGAVDGEGGGAGDATVALATLDVAPGLHGSVTLHLDDRETVRGDKDLATLDRVGLEPLLVEHDLFVGVLVVAHEVARGLGLGDHVQVVAVVAELLLRSGDGLVRAVEGRGVVEERVTPADQGLPVVAGRDGHGVDGALDRGDGLEGKGAGADAVATEVGSSRGGAVADDVADDDGARGDAAEAQGGATREGSVSDVAEVGVVRGVAGVTGAGVAALVVAGDRRAIAAGVAEHRQELGH